MIKSSSRDAHCSMPVIAPCWQGERALGSDGVVRRLPGDILGSRGVVAGGWEVRRGSTLNNLWLARKVFGLAVLTLRLWSARRDIVSLVVAFEWRVAAKAETALHCLEQVADNSTINRDLNLHALVAVEVNNREGFACLIEQVLGYVDGALVPFAAQGLAAQVVLVGVGALVAVGAVVCKGFHDEELIVTGKAGVGGRDGGKAHLADTRRHGRFRKCSSKLCWLCFRW